jgi:hypothetical protein
MAAVGEHDRLAGGRSACAGRWRGRGRRSSSCPGGSSEPLHPPTAAAESRISSAAARRPMPWEGLDLARRAPSASSMLPRGWPVAHGSDRAQTVARTSTRYGLGTWSKVFSGSSLTGMSQFIGFTRSPTTVTRRREWAPSRLWTCSGPIRSSGVRPGTGRMRPFWCRVGHLGLPLGRGCANCGAWGYLAACPLCYNLSASSGVIACARRGAMRIGRRRHRRARGEAGGT